MSGKRDGLRRKRVRYRQSSAFKQRDISGDIFDFRIDYSDQKSWQTFIGRIAIAQQDYPDGVGVKYAMSCVESVVRDIEYRKQGYVYCSPSQLEEALRRMRKEFIRMKG